MLIFFFLVTVYSISNYYLYSKLSSITGSEFMSDVLMGIVILFLTISPVLIPVYSHRGSDRKVKIFSYIGYMWLAFLIPFFSTGIILDLYNLGVRYYGSFTSQDISSVLLSPDSVFLIPLFLSLAVTAYGYFEAKNLRTERLVIKTSKLPEGVRKVRIAQISDLHLGIIIRDKTLNRVIQQIADEKPDLIVSTGDLIDGVIRHIDHLSEKLKNLHAPLGRFAVLGNHEIYGGVHHAVKFIQNAGFTLLRGKGVTVDDTINVAGMDFIGGETHGFSKDSPQRPEWEVLSELPRDLFTLLLKHRSDVENQSLGFFDLQLSGHTHKGQIFPMNLATMFIFSYHTGFTRLEKGSAIYTSRGTGTAGPPIRFLSTPEITIIDIVSE